MSFDKDTRNALAKMVNACRRTLTEDVTNQLQETFGLYSDTSLPLDSLTHLTLDEAEAAQALREQLDHFAAAESGRPEERRRLAYDRLILEIAFTILNRLAALRLCEDRELVIECVRKGTSSDGFRLFNSISGGALGSIHETYRIFLECMMDELALDLGVLFDRANPQSAVFPTDRCLKEILDLLNDPDLAFVWSEDETIGWIYQYFNPPEERRAMREASQAPRNSRELAVRNQLFTPRYVVEFLTDNTLGRMWYEMHKGLTVLMEQCQYLIRRPNEVFLNPGEESPVSGGNEDDLSQEALLKRPVYTLHRPKKDPRDINTLDPACGSAHFLLYCFDLMEIIYVEAWNDPGSPISEATGHTLREDYATIADLHRAMPELIMRRNLHGIDIDMRAVQIAAFALWLRAQRSWKSQGIKAKERPQITKSNIVCAEPMPGETDMLREFSASVQPKVLGRLIDVVFEKMKLAGEAGSLLKIEEEIQEAVTEARKEWIQGPPSVQSVLSQGMRQQNKQIRHDISRKVIDQEFWDLAEERIITCLREYAEHADKEQLMQRRLFAEDAARGFAFLDLCRKRFDVVLMNPPFGDPTPIAKKLIDIDYKFWCKNLASAFIIMALNRLTVNGRIGVLCDRTIIVKSSYEDFRRNAYLLVNDVADLGWGVLDANVEVCGLILTHEYNAYYRSFFDERLETQKNLDLLIKISNLTKGLLDETKTFLLFPEYFSFMPNCAFAYDMPRSVFTIFKKYLNIAKRGHKALQGHNLSMGRFARLWWEVISSSIQDRTFIRMYKGGDYCRFYLPSYEVALWLKDGSFLRNHRGTRWGNESFQEKAAIGYGERGDFLDAHIVPGGHIFTVEGLAIFPANKDHIWGMLAILNSIVCSYLLHFYSGQHKWSGYLEQLPIPDLHSLSESLAEEAKDIFNRKRTIDRMNELSPEFASLQISNDCNYHEFFKHTSENLFNEAEKIRSKAKWIDKEVIRAYQLNLVDLENDLFAKTCPKDVSSIAFDDSNSGSLAVSIVASYMQYIIGLVAGRWDVRIARDTSLAPKHLDPFDPLPVCPPGMLIGPDGLPATSGGISSEEWLKARSNSHTLPTAAEDYPVILDSDYPLRISWNGILVNDPGWEGGQFHRDDIVRRVHEVLELLWGDHVQDIEQEACQILGASDLRDYFRRPSGFFQDHLKRYSKSRRKAPIYWPLSTASGSYTIWLYYHRLNDQTLYAAVNDYLEPKIAEMEGELSRAEEKLKAASGKDASLIRNKINDGRTLLAELKDLRQEILRIAALPYKPDLNDGVIINAAPFHKLFRLRSWAEDTEEVWNKLERGEYDWSHLAYVLWPERVQEACRKDRSIAIAHGLEDICQTPAPSSSKVKRGKRGRRSGRAA